MKLLFFSDLHLGTGIFKGELSNLDMLDLGKDILHQILSLAKLHKATVIFGGDWFHNPINVNIASLNASIEIINRYPSVDIYAISGNHDLSSKIIYETDENGYFKYPDTALTVLSKACPNFKLCDNLPFGVFANVRPGGLDLVIHFIPYFNRGEDFQDYMYNTIQNNDKVNLDNVSILVMHQSIANNGLNLIPDVDLDDCSYNWIMCGHIHKPADLGDIIIMGNPYQRDSGDFGQLKNVYLYDTLSNSFEKIRLDYPNVSKSMSTLQGLEINLDIVEEEDVYQTNDVVNILEKYCNDSDLLNYIKTYV